MHKFGIMALFKGYMLSQSFLFTQLFGIFLFVLHIWVDNLLREVSAVIYEFKMLIVL